MFDTAGQVESSTSPAGYVATYTYDARGLVASITDELGNSQASGYDGAGRLVTATDGRGNDTTFGHDPNGRLETETDPLGGVVGFGYDLAGQRTSVTDPNGAIRTFTFDDGGRLTTAVDAELRSTGYVYDAVSRRTEMTDARGITVTSTFDDAGQLTDRVSPNETQSFSYDDAGRRTAWSDASGATSVVFDDVGRMTGITTPAGVVGYGFNDAGEQETMTQPEGVVAYGYDVNGHMESVTDWRGDTFTMTNDPDGRALTTARSNGVDTAYGYDTAGRLTSVGHNNGAVVIDSFTYDLDGNGNRTGVTSIAGAEVYTLDALNRLTNASYPGAVSEAFVYDDAGNRTSHTKTDGTTVGYTVDDTGQLVSDTTGTTYTYDLAGNLTGTSAGDSYSYDDYSRTTSVTAGATTQTYGYDAAGVRVTVDGIGQLWDRNGLPTLISTGAGDSYVHAAGVARDGDDWLLADAVGSVRATVDNAGATIGTADYSVFGEQLSGAGTFGFAGEQQDPTGLIHLRARQYNPSVGRFTTVDPVQPGAPGTTGYNLYAYSGNNPTTWGDPSGRAVFTEDLTLSSFAIGGVSGAAVLGGAVTATFLTLAMICLSSLAPSCPPSFDFPDIDRDGPTAGSEAAGPTQLGAGGGAAEEQAAATSSIELFNPDALAPDVVAALTAAGVVALAGSQNFPVYRVWGGCAPELGRSWSPVDPRLLEAVAPGSYRDLAGLPNCNTGSMLAIGTMNAAVLASRLAVSILADPLDGNIGGLPEIRFFDWVDVRRNVANVASIPGHF